MALVLSRLLWPPKRPLADTGPCHPHNGPSSRGFQPRLEFSMCDGTWVVLPENQNRKRHCSLGQRFVFQLMIWHSLNNPGKGIDLPSFVFSGIQRGQYYQVTFVCKMLSQGPCVTRINELSGCLGASGGILHSPRRLRFSLSWRGIFL